MGLRLYPTTLKQANALVSSEHRHHAPAVGHKWSGGCTLEGVLVGAYIAGRPVARMTDQTVIAEVTRLVTNGAKNACSMLYSAAARIANDKGYDSIQTFILESESGVSLEAAGWTLLVDEEGKAVLTAGGSWNRPSRGGRRDDQPQERKKKYYKILDNGKVASDGK
jgi:hypothetical protein